MTMKPITVVDARMGRGKSSAAIRYMNQHKGKKRFLYITPFLKEVDRICEQCDFEQPDSDLRTKSTELKIHLTAGRNVAATHSLFYLLDDEALDLVRKENYSLIIDENIEAISRYKISSRDFEIVTQQLSETDETGKVRWIDPEYTGRFSDYKEAADAGFLYHLDNALLNILSPNLFEAFDEIFMLTYLFNGQYQKAYLDCFGFEYRVVGVGRDEAGYYFSDKPDDPPPINYRHLIHIVDSRKMNSVGDPKFSLSKAWYSNKGYDNVHIRKLRNGMRNFFQDVTESSSADRMWTCYKEDKEKLVDKNSGRYRKNFLQISARATNEYKDKKYAAYMVNRFTDPNLKKFFYSMGCSINEDEFALAEMLQWIWRTAIRDNKPITLYIPSARMRRLLMDWIDKVSRGGDAA